MVLNICIREKEKTKIYDLRYHPKKLGKKEQIKPKSSKRKEIIKKRNKWITQQANNREKSIKPKAGSLKCQ